MAKLRSIRLFCFTFAAAIIACASAQNAPAPAPDPILQLKINRLNQLQLTTSDFYQQVARFTSFELEFPGPFDIYTNGKLTAENVNWQSLQFAGEKKSWRFTEPNGDLCSTDVQDIAAIHIPAPKK